MPAADYWPDATAEEETWQPSRYSTASRTSTALVARPVEAPIVKSRSPESGYRRRWKRVIDLAFGVPLFIAAAPIIALAVVGVGLTSGWPAFYRTRRVGTNGREFTMWKLRSMVKDADKVLESWRTSNPELAAEYDANFKLKNDPRVTPLGRILRRTSIDELPQFWNVLRGEMSLVGPRPYYDWELALHPGTAEAITKVRPGVTGPWQVAGRNSLSPAERMFLDRTYVNTCRFSGDLELLLKTVVTLLKPNGL